MTSYPTSKGRSTGSRSPGPCPRGPKIEDGGSEKAPYCSSPTGSAPRMGSGVPACRARFFSREPYYTTVPFTPAAPSVRANFIAGQRRARAGGGTRRPRRDTGSFRDHKEVALLFEHDLYDRGQHPSARVLPSVVEVVLEEEGHLLVVAETPSVASRPSRSSTRSSSPLPRYKVCAH